jgi:hypothetical protein
MLRPLRTNRCRPFLVFWHALAFRLANSRINCVYAASSLSLYLSIYLSIYLSLSLSLSIYLSLVFSLLCFLSHSLFFSACAFALRLLITALRARIRLHVCASRLAPNAALSFTDRARSFASDEWSNEKKGRKKKEKRHRCLEPLDLFGRPNRFC